MSDVFVSYSREDQATARRVAEGLQRAGLSVWWDQTLRMGDAYDEVTERALRSARAVVVLWSRRSVASRWVRAEATIADRAGTLMPVMIEPCDRPVMFELRQTADLSGWQGDESDPRWHAFAAALQSHVRDPGQPAMSTPERSAPVAPIAAGPTSKRHIWPILAVIALALVAAGTWALLHKRSEPTTSLTAARQEPVTIAVLPFTDMSASKDQEAFADGMTEEILNSLARIQDLRVTGRTSSFTFKGKNESLRTIGQKLGVEHLLEGSIRKDGDQLRITAQLIKAKDDVHLWSQTFDRPMKDIFKVQEEIARAVADALQVTLGVGEIGEIPGMTRDFEAYTAWVESRATSGLGNAASGAQAVEKLQVAVRRDPAFAIAWIDLGNAYGLLSGMPSDPVQAGELARMSAAALEEGRRLAPDSEYVRLNDIGALVSSGQWSEAERRIRAVEGDALKSGARIANNSLDRIRLLLGVDRGDAAISALEKERARDPLSSGVAVFLPMAYASTGRLPEAIAEDERYLRTFNDNLALPGALMVARATGDQQRVERYWKRLADITSDPQAIGRRLYERRDRPTEARAELHRYLETHPGEPSSRVGMWAAYFDDDELALKAFRDDRNTNRRFVSAIALWRPIMADMRKLPGFKDLMREWGFVDYWKAYGWGDHCKPVGENDFECH